MSFFDLFKNNLSKSVYEKDSRQKELKFTVTKNAKSVVILPEDVRMFRGDITKTITLDSGQKFSFDYAVSNPEKDLEFWHTFVRTAKNDCLKEYGNNKFPPDTWKLIDIIHILTEYDEEHPDDSDLVSFFDATIFYDKEKKILHYVLEYTYPDPWDSFFFCKLHGEISSDEFNWIAKLITNQEYHPNPKLYSE